VDQSRSRIPHIHTHPLIIDAARRPGWARARDRVLTAAAWLLVAVLGIDAVRFAAAIARRLFAGEATHELEAALAVAVTLGSYAGIVLLNTAAIVAWALYNRLRFQGQDRRGNAAPVVPEELAARYGRTAEEVRRWQGARILVVHHLPEGEIRQVEIGPLPG